MEKRILAIAPIYYPHMGGAERLIHELYTRLPYKVDLLVPNFGGKEVEKCGNLTIYRVCNESKSKIMKLFKYQWFQYKKARELCQKNTYFCIHSHYLFATYWVCSQLQKELKIPWILTENHFGTGMDISSDSENPWIATKLMKRWVKAPKHISSIGVTQYHFIKKLGGKSTLNHLGGTNYTSPLSKVECRKKIGLPLKKKIALSVGRLVRRKRTDILLDAFKNTDWTLIICGKGPEYDELKKDAPKNCLFKGFVNDKEISLYYKACDIFVTASEFEGAGITYFDAMASNIPLVAKRNESSESIIAKETGLLFDDADDLKKILTENSISKIDVKKAHQLFCQKYNWQRYAKDYAELFERYIR